MASSKEKINIPRFMEIWNYTFIVSEMNDHIGYNESGEEKKREMVEKLKKLCGEFVGVALDAHKAGVGIMANQTRGKNGSRFTLTILEEDLNKKYNIWIQDNDKWWHSSTVFVAVKVHEEARKGGGTRSIVTLDHLGFFEQETTWEILEKIISRIPEQRYGAVFCKDGPKNGTEGCQNARCHFAHSLKEFRPLFSMVAKSEQDCDEWTAMRRDHGVPFCRHHDNCPDKHQLNAGEDAVDVFEAAYPIFVQNVPELAKRRFCRFGRDLCPYADECQNAHATSEFRRLATVPQVGECWAWDRSKNVTGIFFCPFHINCKWREGHKGADPGTVNKRYKAILEWLKLQPTRELKRPTPFCWHGPGCSRRYTGCHFLHSLGDFESLPNQPSFSPWLMHRCADWEVVHTDAKGSFRFCRFYTNCLASERHNPEVSKDEFEEQFRRWAASVQKMKGECP